MIGGIILKKVCCVLIGSLSLAIGINAFIIPYHLLDGGMIGLSLIVKYLWGYQTGLTICLLSLPIYLLAWLYFRPIFYNSLHGLLVSSFFIDICAPLNHLVHLPILLSAILGGLFVGLGIGILLRFNVTTGGLDLLAQFIAQKLSINVGLIILVIDALILVTGYKIIGINLILSGIIVCSVGVVTTLLNIHTMKKLL